MRFLSVSCQLLDNAVFAMFHKFQKFASLFLVSSSLTSVEVVIPSASLGSYSLLIGTKSFSYVALSIMAGEQQCPLWIIFPTPMRSTAATSLVQLQLQPIIPSFLTIRGKVLVLLQSKLVQGLLGPYLLQARCHKKLLSIWACFMIGSLNR